MSKEKSDGTLRIGGKEVKVVSQEDAEKVDFVVCGPTSYFPDDVKTVCAQCRTPIVHRPHAPKRPPKVCMTCAVMLSAFEGKLPN